MCCPRATKGSCRVARVGRRDGAASGGQPGRIVPARLAIPNDLIEIAEAPARVPAAQRSVQGGTGRSTNGTLRCSAAGVPPLPAAPEPQGAPCSRANALAQLRA
jgi:hypothetical protein